MRGSRRGGGLIVAVVMAIAYQPDHPWSGLVAAGLVVVLAAMLVMFGWRLTQLQHIRRQPHRPDGR